MVIDFHAHIFPDALAERAMSSLIKHFTYDIVPQTDGTLGGLLADMDKTGVDMSVIVPIATKPTQTETLNRWAADIKNDRIVAFGSVNPHSDDYRRDIDLVVSLGLKGIKLHCEYQDFLVNAPEMMKIYDYAFNKGLIIIQHAGEDVAFKAPFRGTPSMFAEVMRELRGGVMVAAHLGGILMWDEVEKHLCGTDIYLDCSQIVGVLPEKQFESIVKVHGADKILFASDSPWCDPAELVKYITERNLGKENEELIFFKNAQRILNLETNI